MPEGFNDGIPNAFTGAMASEDFALPSGGGSNPRPQWLVSIGGALKGLVSEANQRAANRNEPLWTGIAAAAARKREILARHRTGKGVWYAVVEGLRYDPASRGREVFTIASEKWSSLKAAEAAARRLLVEKAEHFSKWTGIEPRVYTELEWSPRKKGETAGE